MTRPSSLPPDTRLSIYFYLDSVTFTPDTIRGRTSLGGSESAMLMMARALAASDHDVTVFSAKLDLPEGTDNVFDGVAWCHGQDLPQRMGVTPPDVFISLRSTAPFAMKITAGLSMLWNQDLLTDVARVAHALPQIDAMIFVSEFHREQWTKQGGKATRETIGRMPSMVTRNVIELATVPAWPETIEGQRQRALAVFRERNDARDAVAKRGQGSMTKAEYIEALSRAAHPAGCVEAERCLPECEYGRAIEFLCAIGEPGFGRTDQEPVPFQPRSLTRYCYISRPERGLDPLLAMWPEIRRRVPNAELHLCRYDSMYDATGWGAVCAEFDAKVDEVNAKVGGITWHGQLSKADLYHLMTSCSLMLYPGLDDFAETSCIAAIEAQACGCVFVGSYKGALPETLAPNAGILIDGDPRQQAYRDSFIEAVYTLSTPEELATLSPTIDEMRKAGREHAGLYDSLEAAKAWTAWFLDFFARRFAHHKLPILRQLLHYDHHVAARELVDAMLADMPSGPDALEWPQYVIDELDAARERCSDVISQRAQTAEHYGLYSMDTETESHGNTRFDLVIAKLKAANVRTLLDVACGNGSFALAALRAIPDLSVVMLDYSERVLDKARAALTAAGFDGRFRTLQTNLASRPMTREWWELVRPERDENVGFDAVFCGEYLEHTAEPHLVIDWLESMVRDGGLVVFTVPHGPMTEALQYRIPLQRGHTHHFTTRDLGTLLVRKGSESAPVSIEHIPMGISPRNTMLGFWVCSWSPQVDRHPATALDHWRTILTTRPYARVVGMMIVKDAEDWITKCLSSVWSQLDGVLILDTGSTDRTLALIEAFPNVEVRHAVRGQIPTVDGFSAARNAAMAYAEDIFRPDWLVWFDADEHLVHGQLLHQFTTAQSVYDGYVVRQRHLQHHEPSFADVPTRVFRAGGRHQFYGLVHEAPSRIGRHDHPIFPAIDVPVMEFVHLGYETTPVQMAKMARNEPLMRREVAMKGCRRMAYALFMRDLLTSAELAGAETMSERGRWDESVRLKLLSIVRLYHKKGLDSPKHPTHQYAFPYYQRAMALLGVGLEASVSVQAQVRNVPGQPPAPPLTRAKAERLFALTLPEAERLIQHRLRTALDELKPPTFLVRPWSKARLADVDVRDNATRINLADFIAARAGQ